MKKFRVRSALETIARSAIPETIDVWHGIESHLERNDVRTTKLRSKFSVSLILALIALLLISTAAYAYYRFLGSDAGLEGVHDQNLITDINATAVPTIYSIPPSVTPFSRWYPEESAPPATVIAEEVMQNVKVTVNWAYADESRLALRFTIDGMKLPQGLDYGYGAMGSFSVIDANGNILGSKGFSAAAENRDDGSKVITASYYQEIDADMNPALDLKLSIRVGGFDAPYSPPGSDVPPTMLNIPLMGSADFTFRVPVYKGIEFPVNQTVEANGVRMRLETMIVNRSHTELTLCFSMPSKMDWQLWKTTLRYGEGEEYSSSSASNAIAGNRKGDASLEAAERCSVIGFDAPFDGKPTTVNVIIPYLITSVPEVITRERVEAANRKLEAMGIVFEYAGGRVNVLQQPAEMEDWDVHQLIWDALADRYDGPWMFTVDINP